MRGLRGRWIRFLRRFPAYYQYLYAHYQQPESELVQIHLEPTNACNIRCTTCNNPHMTIPTGYMALNKAKALIDEAWGILGAKGVLGLFLRGESVLHRALPEMVAYAKQKGFSNILLSTNAMLLSELRGEALLEAGLGELRISIDAPYPAEFERIRAGASFSAVDRHVKNLRRARQKIGSPCLFRLHASLHRDSFFDIPHFVRRWSDFFDVLKFTVAVNQGGLFSEKKAFEFSHLPFAVSENYKIPCRILYNYIGVNWDMQMSSCCVDYENRFVVGRAEEGLAAVFQNAKSQALRESHRRAQWDSACLRCGFNNILNDWFEDEINDYVHRHRKIQSDPLFEVQFRRFLTTSIRKFNFLAAHPPPSKNDF